jgi:hypothetical protein
MYRLNYYPSHPPSTHFSWAEAQMTAHRNIDNTIPKELWPAVIYTAVGMESIRLILHKNPIVVTSWYRCPELNAAVGSKPTSQHIKGQAVDWICPSFGTPAQTALACREQADFIEFDQLIFEHGWIHTSFTIPGIKPRNQVLTLLKGGTYAQGLTDLEGNAL